MRRAVVWALNRLAPTQFDYEPGDLKVYWDGVKAVTGIAIWIVWAAATGERL